MIIGDRIVTLKPLGILIGIILGFILAPFFWAGVVVWFDFIFKLLGLSTR